MDFCPNKPWLFTQQAMDFFTKQAMDFCTNKPRFFARGFFYSAKGNKVTKGNKILLPLKPTAGAAFSEKVTGNKKK